jgi:hypothetical protein
MDTDMGVDFRGTKDVRLLLKEETHRIIGLSFEVLNRVGHGFHEKVYENALAVAFEQEANPIQSAASFPGPVPRCQSRRVHP